MKANFKEKILFWKPIIELIQDEEKQIKLIGELDLFNNHIEFQITDWGGDIIYNSSYDINKIIDIFYDMIENNERIYF